MLLPLNISYYIDLIKTYHNTLIPLIFFMSLIFNEMWYVDNGYIIYAIYKILFQQNKVIYENKNKNKIFNNSHEQVVNMWLFIFLNKFITYLFGNIFKKILNLSKIIIYIGLYTNQITCEQIIRYFVKCTWWLNFNCKILLNNILFGIKYFLIFSTNELKKSNFEKKCSHVYVKIKKTISSILN